MTNRPAGQRNEAYLAVDLGAESGRAMIGAFAGERITLNEIHRFENRPARLPDGLYWDALGLYAHLLDGIKAGAAASPVSVGIDTWGVDFGLLDRTGALLGQPIHYRDPRFQDAHRRLFDRIPAHELYAATGIQMLPFNTSCQLMALHGSPRMEHAATLLMMPDLLRYWLTGEIAAEETNASTTQMVDARTNDWHQGVLAACCCPSEILPPIVAAGTNGAPLRPDVISEIGLTGAAAAMSAVPVGTHDTASAIAAVPMERQGNDGIAAYISSGTWSLVGVERLEPCLSDAARVTNLTNERGLLGTTRLLRNVMGLWLLQECRRAWAHGGSSHRYDEIVALAEQAPAFGAMFDVDHPSLIPIGDMPGRITTLCRASGQPAPDSPGVFARSIFESLALAYRCVIRQIERVTGDRVSVVHIVGGGARNQLLCQLTADATGLPVQAGPAEATALGNILAQLLARGRVRSLAEMREIVRASVAIEMYEPTVGDDIRQRWDHAVSLVDAQRHRESITDLHTEGND